MKFTSFLFDIAGRIPTFSWRRFIVVSFWVCVPLLLLLSVRGLPGNPNIYELNSPVWTLDGPLELSPERGRFALLYSIVEDGSLSFSSLVARLALPDLGISDSGKYVSLFAPGVSFLMIPGYLFGKALGASQVFTYLTIVLFAIANVFLIRSIAFRLGAGYFTSLFAGLVFVFATPAFAYSVNLYQHHVSTFLLLLSIWILLHFRSWWSFAFIWFLCSLAVVIDNPNIFLLFPVGLFALVRLFRMTTIGRTPRMRRMNTVRALTTFVGFLVPLGLFAWYNFAAYGDPFQLPGTLQGVDEIGIDGRPSPTSTYERQIGIVQEDTLKKMSKEKTAIGFFDTRNLLNGFYIHLFSPDRGVIYFAPVIFVGIAGLFLLYRNVTSVATLFIALIGVNVLLYSMWGDPWGGWAFGSRYLIPSYAICAIGIAFAISEWGRRWWFIIITLLLFVYSSGVNTLGAITTSANPPQIEVLSLELQSGHEEKYTFLRNWEVLNQKYGEIGSKSFVYQTFLKEFVTPLSYYFLMYSLILILGFSLYFMQVFSKKES